MNGRLQDVLDWSIGQYSQGSRLVLLFDYDGTLTEFCESPRDAKLPVATARALQSLTARPGVTVGIISGRELDDLKQMVGLPGLDYSGSSGLEVETEGHSVVHPLAQHSAQLLRDVDDAVERRLRDLPGAWLERKHFGLSVHYRQLDPRLASHLHHRLENELARWGERLHVVTGAKVTEITPNLGWTKGTAVDFLLDRFGPEHPVVFFAGDEGSDVEAMWEVSVHKGITIGIGNSPPAVAQYKLPDVESVRSMLDRLSSGLGKDVHKG